MTPVEIAAQIKNLYADLHTALADDDSEWDGDYAALLGEMAKGFKVAAKVSAKAQGNVEGFEGVDWESASLLLHSAACDLTSTFRFFSGAASCASDAQAVFAAEIAAATAH